MSCTGMEEFFTPMTRGFFSISRSAAMALMQMLAIAASLRFVVPVMFAPALLAWLSSFLLEPVFARYETPDA